MSKKVQGYFTVEAALLFPFVLGSVIFVVYFWFYQYNRCLMEQDMGALSLWADTVETQDKEQLIKLLEKRETEIYTDKYVAWQQEKTEIKLEKDMILVKRRGQIAFPFAGLGFWGGDTAWKAEATYENHRISPTLFVRSCRKMIGGR